MTVTQRLVNYIEENLFEPGSTWPIHIFNERAYSRWAAYEILERLMDHPFDPPDVIIESFIFELAVYAQVEKSRQIFTVARDAAQDIIEAIIQQRHI